MKNYKIRILVISGVLLGLLGLLGVLISLISLSRPERPDRNINMAPNIQIINKNKPLINNNKPLPHNGLFIRRNNEFGTRLNVGIKDLIEQGVLFEQRNIRFDDFIALNSEGIPLPKSDNSLAVSYGITPIPRKQKRNQEATHYLEIALKTADTAPAEYQKSESPPVNYIFVIDTSGSMTG